MERTKQILNKELSVKNVNNDTYLKINIENSQRLLPTNEIYKIVNVAERFNVERQRCKSYRIIGTMNTTMSNPLFNLAEPINFDKYTWSWLNSTIDFLDTSYPKDGLNDETDLTYIASIKNNLKEKDGWFGVYDPDVTKSGLCNYIDMEPKRERFSFIPDKLPFLGTVNQQPVKNWELTITYPASSYSGHTMVNGGILITNRVAANLSTRDMTAIGLSCKHNLNVGDVVRIFGTTGYDGDHVVVRTGLDNGDLKEFYFVIDKPSTGVLSPNSRIKKLINNVESEYYFRKFRKIKTKVAPIIETDDYEAYRVGFSENFFNDSIIQFVFNEDIDVTDLVDNLGRPLSELYLTIIKTDSNKLFTNVSSGIETPYDSRLVNSNTIPYLRNIPSIHRIHNGTSGIFPTHTALETNVNINNTNDIYGDLVEFNVNTLTETVLSTVSHRFNTINRENTNTTLNYVYEVGKATAPLTPPKIKTINLGPRHEGYYYQPHHLIKIRDFSSYIEVGDQFTGGVPSYAIDLGDTRIVWRDLLDIGFNESDIKPLDYPFLNNSHYMYDNYCFSVRRQDPFGVWGLYYGKFPADPTGDRITDKFTINSEDDVC
jgi:hypothetical protein